MEHRKKIILTAQKSQSGFTLIELLIVLSILSMMAGVVLPSAAVLMQKSRLNSLVHRVSIFCRESFERSVFSGRQYMVSLNDQRHLVASFYENSRWNPVADMWLQPIDIATDFEIDWPEKGWYILPEGYCETPLIIFHDKVANETVRVKIRAYDAQLVVESGKNSLSGASK